MKISKYRNLDKYIEKIRKEYHFGKLERKDLTRNPFDQLEHWLLQAIKRKDPKANVMVLATSSAKGKVSSRSVLLKGISEKGLLFYTHKNSLKARQLDENPQASVCFYWGGMERQVTVMGRVMKIPQKEAELYFRSRPREAQIAAWCTEQSRVIRSREELDRRFEAMKRKFAGREIPISPYWTGYCLKPGEFEFWQGRANRMNDRFRYRPKSGRWLIERLQP
jgi:pyridoxamine 5'-phosphate oxidase